MDPRSRDSARRAIRQGKCPWCGYDIRGPSAMVCPECGRDWTALGVYTPTDPGSPRRARLAAIVATLLILVVAAIQQLDHIGPAPAGGGPAAAAEVKPPDPQVELTAKLMMKLYFAMRSQPGSEQYARNVLEMLERERTPEGDLRAAIIVAEVEGPGAAEERLLELIDEAGPEAPLGRDARTLLAIHEGEADPGAVEELVRRHGWFGELAATYEMPMADPDRREVAGGGGKLMAVLLLFGGLLVVVGLAALGLFITAIVLVSTGKVRPRFVPPAPGGSVAIETVAVFVAGFIGLKVLAGAAAGSIPDPSVAIGVTLGAQWLLVALVFWPVVRGVRAARVMEMWGLHRGAGVLREIGLGLLGYLALLPLLVVGVCVSLVLMVLYEVFSRAMGWDPPKPKNEIFEVLGSAEPWMVVLLMLLASLWAPLVEECIFRGALYRHLRSRWHWLAAAVVTALGFGLMHGYQLFLLGPVIALGFGFALLREWRGSLIASMTAHCFHNTVVISMLLLFMRYLLA